MGTLEILDFLAPVVAVAVRKADVQQNQMGLKGAEISQNIPEIPDQAHLIVPGSELALQDAGDFRGRLRPGEYET